MAKHTELGNKGEAIAADYLLRNGYQVLERNYRYKKTEVDIIAKKDLYIISVEVKTRSSVEFGDPQDFLKPKQIQRLVLAMDQYLVSKEIDLEVRFDIIAIVNKGKSYDVEHIENAFYHF